MIENLATRMLTRIPRRKCKEAVCEEDKDHR